MSEHQWNVGDVVKIKPEYEESFADIEPETEYKVIEVDEVGDPLFDTSILGWFYACHAREVFDIL